MRLDAEAIPELKDRFDRDVEIRPVFLFILLIQGLNVNFSLRADRGSRYARLSCLTERSKGKAVRGDEAGL